MQKIKWLVLIPLMLALAGSIHAQVTTRIFIVRHADRLPGDDLSPAGVIRANELKRVLLNTGIDSVFSTNFVRTRKTVKPLADAEGLPVLLYDSNPQLLKRVLKTGKGKTVLVAGHSNTVAQFIKSCGCKPPYENIPDTQFDNLFLVIVQHPAGSVVLFKSSCKLLHMKYGAVTN